MTRPFGRVLPLLAGLLVASAVLRLGGDVRPALAQGLPAPDTVAAGAEEVICPAPAAPSALLAALQARESRADEREAGIEARMAALREAEAEIEAQLAALSAAEESLAATLNLASTAAETDLGQLTLVYENMPAPEVAALFEEMDPQFSSGFLARMDPPAAAEVMTHLTPTTAYSISVVIAGRNANAPRD